MHVLCAEQLRSRNTMALPSLAEGLVAVRSPEEILRAMEWARERQLSVLPLGEGSNIILAGDLQALVVLQTTRGIEVLDQSAESVQLRVSAGENWHQLVTWTLKQGYYGLENLALIPGTVGAAPIQNIGAYGVELCSVLDAVHGLYLDSGERFTFGREECQFGYRDSIFKQSLRDSVIITEVDIRLSRRQQVALDYPALTQWLDEHRIVTPTAHDVFRAVVDIRQGKLPDPVDTPNAGSFFKNPVLPASKVQELADRFPGLPSYPAESDDGASSAKLPAAWLIDHCGWKGYREGPVGVHPDHALVLVNYGGASGEQVLSLASRIADSVVDSFGVRLEIEPRVYGGE